MAQETVLIKVELEWEKAPSEDIVDDTTTGLYARHEIKNEVMIGPELLQPRDTAYPARVPVSSSNTVEVNVKPEADDVIVKTETEEVTIKIEPVDTEQQQTEHTEWVPDVCKQETARVKLVNIEDIKQALQAAEQGSAIQFGAETRIKPNTKHSKSPNTVKYTCNICKKQFKTKSYLEMHIMLHEQFQYTCKKCKKHFPCEPALSAHVDENACHAKKKKKEKKKSCNSEKKKKKSCNSEIDSNVKHYGCDECGKKFLKKSFFKAHKGVHLGVKPFECEICKREFSTKFGLSIHTRRTH